MYSAPGMKASASTTLSCAAAAAYAAGSAAAVSTREIPTDEPCVEGFTNSGKPSAEIAASKSAGPRSSTKSAVAMPTAAASRLVRALSMHTAEPSTPLPV